MQTHPTRRPAIGGSSRDKRGRKRERDVLFRIFSGATLPLGVMYAIGQGVTQDATEAVRWYRKAAAQGHPDALTALRALGALRNESHPGQSKSPRSG